MDNNETYLRLEVIWKDDDMFELKVKANNSRYSGMTEVYEVSKSLLSFTDELKGFPFGKDRIKHSYGEKDSYAYFEMDFYKIDLSGKCGVLVTLEENVSTEYREEEEKDKLSLELIVEPNAIDSFLTELKTLAQKESGTAELFGINNYTINTL